ncbi:MAG: MerR family transcriptional regulator [Verrucomicrobia bacterium]|nr:MerR family transcriptional regulator [Verrucomicrobiota bacterium]
MAYTVKELVKISGVTVRTIHWYDEVGLLKPAYHGSNGYRYYEEGELLILQQLLFFRELGFTLKQIQRVLGRSDFDKMVALRSHREVLKKNLEQTKKLLKTIDKTIKHLKGSKKMKEKEMFSGFSKEKQAIYEKEIIERFGERGRVHIAESKERTSNHSKEDQERLKIEFVAICKELTLLLNQSYKVDTKEVQNVVRKHYLWLKQFWTPTKESYTGYGEFVITSDLKHAYEEFHPDLPKFLK